MSSGRWWQFFGLKVLKNWIKRKTIQDDVPPQEVQKFPHLAIAISLWLEVESSNHIWLDGCNQRDFIGYVVSLVQLLVEVAPGRHPVCIEDSGAADAVKIYINGSAAITL